MQTKVEGRKQMKWSNNYFEIQGKPQMLKIHQKNCGSVIAPYKNQKFLLIEIIRDDNEKHLEFPHAVLLKQTKILN